MIPVKKDWTTCPTYPHPIRKDGVARGLRIALFPEMGGIRDRMRGSIVAYNSGQFFVRGSKYGQYARCDGSGGGSMALNEAGLNNDWINEVTAFSIWRSDTHDTSGYNVFTCSGGGNDFMLNYGAAANETLTMRIGVGNVNDADSIGGTGDHTQWTPLQATRVNGSGQYMRKVGETGAWDTGSTGAPNTMRHPIYVFSGGGNAALDFVTALFWNRDISEQEFNSLVANPYQIFEPITTWLPTESAAAPATGKGAFMTLLGVQ